MRFRYHVSSEPIFSGTSRIRHYIIAYMRAVPGELGQTPAFVYAYVRWLVRGYHLCRLCSSVRSHQRLKNARNCSKPLVIQRLAARSRPVEPLRALFSCWTSLCLYFRSEMIVIRAKDRYSRFITMLGNLVMFKLSEYNLW